MFPLSIRGKSAVNPVNRFRRRVGEQVKICWLKIRGIVRFEKAVSYSIELLCYPNIIALPQFMTDAIENINNIRENRMHANMKKCKRRKAKAELEKVRDEEFISKKDFVSKKDQ